jgi:hypothetical protein
MPSQADNDDYGKDETIQGYPQELLDQDLSSSCIPKKIQEAQGHSYARQLEDLGPSEIAGTSWRADQPTAFSGNVAAPDLLAPAKVTLTSPWSRKVTDIPTKSRSNKVTRRYRRLDKNDIQTLGKIPTTTKSPSPLFDPPLVDVSFNPLPSHLHHSNDNARLPVWEHSGDRVKLTFANRGLVSLGGARTNPAAFSLNLTLERIAEAQRHPKGFIDSLKRDLDRTFNRMIGEISSYWFGAGATRDGRLHLHGAIHISEATAPIIDAALRKIGGEWPKHVSPDYQLDLRPMTDADGWVRYVLKQGPSARRLIITGKSLTIPKELRREGHRLYDALRLS